MSTIQVGDLVPNFTAPATNNTTVTLSDYRGKNVVLYFYPKDSTPGCTIEGNDFTRLHDKFSAENAVIFGISMDSMKRHENFKAKQNFAFELISDEAQTVCDIFGVVQLKKNFGKEYMGIVRSTFLINTEGKLAKAWHKVSVKGHAEEVLEFVKNLA